MKCFQTESDYLDYFWWKEHYTVHGLIEAKDRSFCTLCDMLNRHGGTGVSEEGDNKYQDFISWFKMDKCWQPAWLDLIGLDAGPDV